MKKNDFLFIMEEYSRKVKIPKLQQEQNKNKSIPKNNKNWTVSYNKSNFAKRRPVDSVFFISQ